ncbi:LbtU family siderophore porin [Desulfarculus baarsii]
MKVKLKVAAWLAAAAMLVTPAAAFAADADTQALLNELRALKERVSTLEQALEKANTSAADAQKAAQEAQATSAHSLKMSEQAQLAKGEQVAGGLLSDAGKRLKIYGAVELEGAYSNFKPKHGKSASESDFTLATAEVFIEADINKYVKGLVHMLYEEGDTDPMNIDEAYILLGQTDDIPAYFLGGRMYPAIGLFESNLISDPITQNVFETQATAAEVGWAQDWFNVGVGIFNSDVHESSDAPDNNINTFYARAQFDAPEGALGEDVDLNFGLAYTNNIASGNLSEYVVDQSLQDLVAGWSAMLSAQYKCVAFTAEYISAIDDFKAGELDYMTDSDGKPYAYNIELAYMPFEDWTFAARYEGSDNLGDKEPEHQFGVGASWMFLPDTTLSVEYLHGEFQDTEDERDLFTTQLAIGF